MSPQESIADFQRFLAELNEPDGLNISPSRYAKKLKLTNQELADLAHVHRRTLRDAPQSAQLQRFLRDAVRVLHAASDFARGEDYLRVLYWFRNWPIGPLEYKTAETLVSEGRTEQVLEYINNRTNLRTGAG